MNYLAHLYLAENTPESIIGNFLGDFVKGSAINLYNEEIKKGIILHRKIDVFTDSHLLFKASKQLININHKRYAGIIVDIFYDHLLAKNWLTYSQTPLLEFSAKIYAVLDDYCDLLPEKLQRNLPYMKADNFLISYADTQGISYALQRISSRLKRPVDLELSLKDLIENYQRFEYYFNKFFPELIDYSKTFK